MRLVSIYTMQAAQAVLEVMFIVYTTDVQFTAAYCTNTNDSASTSICLWWLCDINTGTSIYMSLVVV